MRLDIQSKRHHRAAVKGFIQVSDKSPVTAITVAGKDVTSATAAHPVMIHTVRGTLIVTGYDAASGKVTYRYVEEVKQPTTVQATIQ